MHIYTLCVLSFRPTIGSSIVYMYSMLYIKHDAYLYKFSPRNLGMPHLYAISLIHPTEVFSAKYSIFTDP